MQADSIEGKRVLITGVTGFVGKALEKRLGELGAKVFGISRSINNDKKNLRANILDYSTINNFIIDSKSSNY